jgi:hypothetical protein
VGKNRTNKIQELGLTVCLKMSLLTFLANNDGEKRTEEFKRLATPITIRW